MDERWEGDGLKVRCRREVIRFMGLICLENATGVDKKDIISSF